MIYKITLTPLGRYFFGGDMTFATGDKSHDDAYMSYIIDSARYPQQTTLLGMLRFLVLSNDVQAFDRSIRQITDKDRATSIIGGSSFRVEAAAGYPEISYGLIRRLYPCYLELEEGNTCLPLLPAPLDRGYKVSCDSTQTVTFNGHTIPRPIVEGYNPKAYGEPLYVGAEAPIPESDLFVTDSRIGITKDYKGKTDEDEKGFYKQNFCRLGNVRYEGRLHFAFYVEVDDSLPLSQPPYDGSIVNLGGDDSKFLLRATKCAEASDTLLHYPALPDTTFAGYARRIVLLSDAYLPGTDPVWSYAITATAPFRFLQTTVAGTKSYHVLSRAINRSNKFYLFSKGSVFFCIDEQEDRLLEEALCAPRSFRQIGYNYYETF